MSQNSEKQRGRPDNARYKGYSRGSHRGGHSSRSRSPVRRSPPRRPSKSSKYSPSQYQSHRRERSRSPPPRRRSRSPKDKHSYSVSSKEESDRHRKHLPQKGRLSESFVKSSFQHSDKAKHADGAKQSAEEVEGNTLGNTLTPKPKPSRTIMPGIAQSPASPLSLLGSVPVAKGTGGIMESIPLDDKERLKLAIAAAQDIATKLPAYSAPINTVQQKVNQEKRKLLWSGKKKVAQTRNQWESVSFGKQGEDSKFRRLMGIGESKGETTSVPQHELKDETPIEGRDRTLNALEQQYEASRYLTHIARGAGLGYGTQALTTELPSQKDPHDKLHETL